MKSFNIRLYLRASTDDQNALRAKADVMDWLNELARDVFTFTSTTYVDNFSGRKKSRPALDKLLSDANPGDILLVEAIDRLSRLKRNEWKLLKAEIESKQVVIVAKSLPLSHEVLKGTKSQGMLDIINELLIEVAAETASEDYETRRARQRQGIASALLADAAKPKSDRLYKGKQVNVKRNDSIRKLLATGHTYKEITTHTGASPAHIAKIKKGA